MKTKIVGLVVAFALSLTLLTGCGTHQKQQKPLRQSSSYNNASGSGAVTFAGSTTTKGQNNPTQSEVRYIIANSTSGDIKLSIDGAPKTTIGAKESVVVPVTTSTVVVVSGTNGMFMMELTVPPVGRPARLIEDADFK